jgi:hypothetical protein
MQGKSHVYLLYDIIDSFFAKLAREQVRRVTISFIYIGQALDPTPAAGN